MPETHLLHGDDARQTLRRVGLGRLFKDSVTRLYTADGTTLMRALAHAGVLTAFPALITIIGIATQFHLTAFRDVLERTLTSLAPGGAGELLAQAFRQGSRSGGAALAGGLAGVLISGTTAMAQVERGCNRIYGMTRDRTLWRKLLVGFLMNITAGILFAGAFILIAAGGAVGKAITSSGNWSHIASTTFEILRWPAGIIVLFVALTMVYKIAPNRAQPSAGWLQTGTVVATILGFGLTALLALYYGVNDRLGSTYGPLIGVIALLTWAYAMALALYFGMAVAAQLEAERAGLPGPRTRRRYNEAVRSPDETAEGPPPTPALAAATSGPDRFPA